MFKLTAAFISICYGSFFFSLQHTERASPYGAFGVGDLFCFFGFFFLHASPWVTKTKHLPRGRSNPQLPAVSDSSPPICSFRLSNSMNPSSFVPELSKALRSPVTIFNLRECSLPRVISKSLSVLINRLRFQQRKLTRLQRHRNPLAYVLFHFILRARH